METNKDYICQTSGCGYTGKMIMTRKVGCVSVIVGFGVSCLVLWLLSMVFAGNYIPPIGMVCGCGWLIRGYFSWNATCPKCHKKAAESNY
jgi:hypothetical protein